MGAPEVGGIWGDAPAYPWNGAEASRGERGALAVSTLLIREGALPGVIEDGRVDAEAN